MRLLITIVVLALASPLCLAEEDHSPAEFQGFYQRIQGFDFKGIQGFEFEGEGFHGGGFGFVFNMNSFFGVFTQASFMAGVQQSNTRLRFINLAEGIKLTKRTDHINFFGKGGVGFVRHVTQYSNDLKGVEYGSSFQYGGGAEIKMSDRVYLLLDLSRFMMRLPQVAPPGPKDKWDSNWMITAGISIPL